MDLNKVRKTGLQSLSPALQTEHTAALTAWEFAESSGCTFWSCYYSILCAPRKNRYEAPLDPSIGRCTADEPRFRATGADHGRLYGVMVQKLPVRSHIVAPSNTWVAEEWQQWVILRISPDTGLTSEMPT